MKKDEYLIQLTMAIKDQDYSKAYVDLCIAYASRLLDNNLPVIFDLIHLSKLLGISRSDLTKHLICENLFYKKVTIPKKSGGTRELNIPEANHKRMQRWILDNILYNIPISSVSNGFCRDRSIVSNAEHHLNKKCVINVDIKDFFPTIEYINIYKVFRYYGYTKEVSLTLAKICTLQDILPQGSPASPYLSNIVCVRLDYRLNKLAEKYEAVYTRYADDITFSGKYGIQNSINAIKEIIVSEGFSLNENKTRVQYTYQQQEVTGLLVNNEKLKINRKYKRKTMQEIYFCQKYGVSNHLEHIDSHKSFYKEHLYGKVYYIKMVEPALGNELLSMLENVQWEY